MPASYRGFQVNAVSARKERLWNLGSNLQIWKEVGVDGVRGVVNGVELTSSS